MPAPNPSSGARDEEVAPPSPPAPPAPYPSARASAERAQLWVKATLFVVISGLLYFCIALPIPGPRREVAQLERQFGEVQLVLSEMRALLADFRADHGIWPGQGRDGYGDPSLLQDQIAQPTGHDGVVLRTPPAGGRPERARGPYRNGGVPPNPVNGLSSVRFLRADEPWPDEADGRTGWLYRPATGEIRANLPGRAFPSAPRFMDL
jgi:hypothetical protein